MRHRVRPLMLGVLALAALVGAPVSRGLERLPGPAPADAPRDFRASGSCSVAYYNFCTGWIWQWSGWQPGQRFGTQFTPCANSATLVASWIYVTTAAPSGYGFTGTLGAFAADASRCPQGAALASQAFLPTSGWNWHAWDVSVPGSFAMVVETGPAPGLTTRFYSDHPAIGPSGPLACGTCYPATRVTHSFQWGSASAPLCPGTPFFDGFCNAELYLDVGIVGAASPVEPESWGAIKALYR